MTNDLGVFVSASGLDVDSGTREMPLATLGAALAKAASSGKGKIFICEGTYTESVEIKATFGVYGGFACGDWSFTGKRPRFIGTTPDFVLKVNSVTGVSISDLELQGADAKAGTGQNSVALLINLSRVRVVRSRVVAGAGGSGADGLLKNFVYGAPPTGGNAALTTGGAAISNACPAGDSSTGGKGGNGTLASSFSGGTDGSPSLGGGKGGSGGATCNPGDTGSSAPNRPPAPAVATVGSMAGAGWLPSAGDDGAPGQAGQGGGGGGGRDTGSLQGGGGGGGTGGCGGAGGGGGKGGGGSIAILANGSAVTLELSELVSNAGGAGGTGKAGQTGQVVVGVSGTSVPPGCQGGSGGSGGSGGAGAGGAGGISVGILYKGTRPVTDSGTDAKITVGTKGSRGLGGATPTNDGIDGVAQAVLQVP